MYQHSDGIYLPSFFLGSKGTHVIKNHVNRDLNGHHTSSNDRLAIGQFQDISYCFTSGRKTSFEI